jgi:hypothetical protein
VTMKGARDAVYRPNGIGRPIPTGRSSVRRRHRRDPIAIRRGARRQEASEGAIARGAGAAKSYRDGAGRLLVTLAAIVKMEAQGALTPMDMDES